MTTTTTTGTTRQLASHLADLRFEELPNDVVARTKELFLDWVSSVLAGRSARPVEALERFAEMMGPDGGPSEILVSRRRSSPLFAALVNGASSHVVEQDDVHNESVFHPATVVFAGTLAAAAAVARLLGSDGVTILHALGSAGTQAAGLWEFLRDAADSKQLHTAKAAADGLLSAYLARDGFTGATRILEGEQGMAAGMSDGANPAKLVEGLGEKWAVLETSFKFHASCRHTHPAADALLKAMREHDLGAGDVARVRARGDAAALDVLGPVTDPRTHHQAKVSMGFVLALIALYGRAGVNEFTEEALRDPELREFAGRVEMVFDREAEVDTAETNRWVGLVEVETTSGERIVSRVDIPKGDPGNELSRAEIQEKAHRLTAYQEAASAEEMDTLIGRAWNLDREQHMRDLLPG